MRWGQGRPENCLGGGGGGWHGCSQKVGRGGGQMGFRAGPLFLVSFGRFDANFAGDKECHGLT